MTLFNDATIKRVESKHLIGNKAVLETATKKEQVRVICIDTVVSPFDVSFEVTGSIKMYIRSHLFLIWSISDYCPGHLCCDIVKQVWIQAKASGPG